MTPKLNTYEILFQKYNPETLEDHDEISIDTVKAKSRAEAIMKHRQFKKYFKDSKIFVKDSPWDLSRVSDSVILNEAAELNVTIQIAEIV